MCKQVLPSNVRDTDQLIQSVWLQYKGDTMVNVDIARSLGGDGMGCWEHGGREISRGSSSDPLPLV